MCGICGSVTANPSKRIEEATLRRMCDLIWHRGPDDEGYYLDDLAGLGMRRLSIIDLESGHQPISNENDKIWVVYNGEIYNFQEMRASLEKKGHFFKTRSDTEVIVHAYEEYGDRCVEKLNGMFAFALWDMTQNRLLLARDHLGIKPLYYWVGNDEIVFGSELKTVIAHPRVPKEIDPNSLDMFLSLEYIPSPKTIFKNIYKLPAGHRLVFQDWSFTLDQYWEISFHSDLPDDENQCAEMLDELIKDAVRHQMISDVPLGAFLSGGIDSSSVVAVMSEISPEPIKTFSIGFEDSTYDELPYARQVALRFGTDHYEETLRPDIASTAEKLMRHLDEPFADFSVFPTYLVSQVARQNVKVVLSGDGGDELFGGYDAYVAQNLDRYYQRLPSALRRRVLPTLLSRIPPQPAKKGLINKAKRFVEGANLPLSLQHARWMIFMNAEDKERLYQPGLYTCLDGNSPERILEAYFAKAAQAEPLAQQQYVDVKTYLVEDILTKVDRMSMAVSLETRVPLLDYRIVEFALNLPDGMKLYRGQTKRILKRAMSGRLPDEILNKPKQGFSIPLKHWLRGPLKPMMIDLLSNETVKQRGYFKPETVTEWVSEHLEGRANHSHRLWALMVFELWHRQVFEMHSTPEALC